MSWYMRCVVCGEEVSFRPAIPTIAVRLCDQAIPVRLQVPGPFCSDACEERGTEMFKAGAEAIARFVASRRGP